MAGVSSSKLERCLLVDTPTPLFQAILQQLTSFDYLNLRLVSQSVCQRINQQIPYRVLRLCANSTTGQVQQWFQATHRSRHVTSLSVQLTGAIPAEVFNSTMQLLSQRTALTELHLLDAVHVHSVLAISRARVTPIKPLQYFLSNLQTLVIKGVHIPDIPTDLQYLAAAAAEAKGEGGWQLQNLTLDVAWRYSSSSSCAVDSTPCLWSTFSQIMQQLVAAFPHLQQLTLRMPTIGVMIKSAQDPNGPGELADAIHTLGRTSGQIPIFAKGFRVSAAAAAVSAVAAVANAAVQLKELTVLAVTDVPDIWRPKALPPSERVGDLSEMTRASAVALVAAGASTDDGAAVTDASFRNGHLDATAEAAAEALRTLDDFGSLLLQHHPVLQEASVTTAMTDWSMSWRRQRLQQQPETADSHCNSASASMAAPDLVAAAVTVNSNHCRFQLVDPIPAANQDVSSNNQDFVQLFTYQLPHYSSRPAYLVMSHISSCDLVVEEGDVNDKLTDLLGDLKSLKDLKISVSPAQENYVYDAVLGPIWPDSSQAVAATITAAAAVPHLQSLTLGFCGPAVKPLPDALLPLTAAAGGPGSSLTKLVLSGYFAAETSLSANWLEGLKQLDALRELHMLQCGDEGLLRLNVYCLPSSLTYLHAVDLMICCSSADTVAVDSDAAADDLQEAACFSVPAYKCPVQLQMLQLSSCQLSSPSILASDQLQQLSLGSSSWSGGWAAAAAAWPNIRDLSAAMTESRKGVKFDSRYSSPGARLAASGYISSSELDRADLQEAQRNSVHVMQELACGFRRLSTLSIYGLPWLSLEVLQPLQLHSLKHLRLVVAIKEYFMDSRRRRDESSGPEPAAVPQPTLLHLRQSLLSLESTAVREPTAVQNWLQQHQPWASTDIS